MGEITANTRLVGVIGHPVAHSLSPAMHNAEFRRLGLDYVYAAWDVAPEKLDDAVRGLKALGAAGINVTVPHKQAVISSLDELAPEAKLIGAVNTVRFDPGHAVGFNTDAAGWVNDIQCDLELGDQSIAVIGAGGAARAVAVGACQAGAGRVVICNRRFETAEALGEILHHHFHRVKVEWSGFCGEDCRNRLRQCNVVVNTTPVGMAMKPGSPLPVEWLLPGQFVYDTVYTPAETELIVAARARGCRTRNGIGMLTRQGAKAFHLWTGIEPDADAMETTLREQLAG